MNQKRITCFSLLLFLLASVCAGQAIDYKTFSNIYLDNEVPAVRCVMQDKQGLIWMGTNNGLYSYDGYTAQHHADRGNNTWSEVHCGIPFKDDWFILGTDNGVFKFNFKTDSFEKLIVPFNSDTRALLLLNNELWLGTTAGLYMYNVLTSELRNVGINVEPNAEDRLVYALVNEGEYLYIATASGLLRLDRTEETYSEMPLYDQTGKEIEFVNSLLKDSFRGCIWIGTGRALLKYIPSTGITEYVDRYLVVKSMTLDNDNNLVIGTDNGLNIFRENRKEQILHDARIRESLIDNIIWSVFKDRDGNIWLGTDYGVSMAECDKGFEDIPISRITGSGEGNQFFSLFKDSKGFFWLGGTNGVIRTDGFTADTSNVIWYQMGNVKHRIIHNRIRCTYEDSQNNLWVGGDGGIILYDYSKSQFVRKIVTDTTGTLSANWIYDIVEDRNNMLWIGSCLGGVFRVDPRKMIEQQTLVADKHYSVMNGLSGNDIDCLVPDIYNNIWVLVHNIGLNKIDSASGEVSVMDLTDYTGGECLRTLIGDSDGFIWSGFRGGILRIDPGSGKTVTVRFSEKNNSRVLATTQVGEDIWVSTTEGIWCVDRRTLNTEHLSLTSQSFTSVYFDSTLNKVYLGGFDDIVISSPVSNKNKEPYKPIIITSLRINDESSTFDDYNSELNIRYLEHIRLKYDHNDIFITFSDLRYGKEQKTMFTYKLEGFDNEWNILGTNNNSITFSNLKARKYELLISRAGTNGLPVDEIRTIDLQIYPIWYKSLPARIVYGIIGLLVIMTVFNLFTVRNRLKYEKLEKEQSLEQARSKLAFFSDISHEFKTPLSLIIAPVSQMLNEVKAPVARKTLELVQQNAMKLNSLIHQAIDFYRDDSQVSVGLIPTKVELVEFARSIFLVYEESCRDKNIEFVFNTSDDSIFIRMDVVKIESVLNNLLSNACKYSGSGDSVMMSINSLREGKTEIKVSDTGIGIPSKDLPYIFQKYFKSSNNAIKNNGSGIGLYLVKSYVELHGGTVQVSSDEESGTTFSVVLPSGLNAEEEDSSDTLINNSIEDKEKRLIVIVEDNSAVAEFVKSLLDKEYNCLIAQNGKTGLKLCTELLPDLIIADIMMPVMDGLEMSRRIRNNIATSTIPLILLTAHDDKHTELESINFKVDAFIPKPFDPSIIISRVRQLIDLKIQLEKKLRLEQIADPQKVFAESLDEKLLAGITHLIENKIADPDFNVNTLSLLADISQKQLYRKIKHLTGLTTVDYIKSIRMKKAALMLSSKKFTVAEVMYMVGFSNHSYFAKCFFNEYGKTPQQYTAEQEA